VKNKFLLSLVFLLNTLLYAQTNVRVMSYNLLNYPNARSNTVSISSIEPYYKKIINYVNPDVLIVVEMLTQDGVTSFQKNVLGNDYAAAPVEVTGNGSGENDCAMFYKASEFEHINTTQLSTLTRNICEFTIVHQETNDTLIVYGVHLKANTTSGDNTQNLVRRAAEVDSLRKKTKQLGRHANYIVAGDFNILNGNETAFIKLLDSSSPGYLYDPLQSFGEWNDNSAFANTHSYSATKLATRFDMILMSQGVIDEGGVDYIPGSFKILGNDANHFNKSVLDGSNYWFTDNFDLGYAITQASDHLPVYADYLFGVQTSDVSNNSGTPTSFLLEQNYPNPFNPTTVINYQLPKASNVTLQVFDILGREVSTLVNIYQKPGTYNSEFSILNSQLSSGVYFYRLTAGEFFQTKKMLLLK
jgi:endonuclease/exonuclease/phosphatase family metal-dependent hydrolase